MTTQRLWFTSALCLALGCAAGYLQPADNEQNLAQPITRVSIRTGTTGGDLGSREERRDFGEALLTAASYPSPLHREHALKELFAQLTPGDFPIVIAAALKLPKEDRAEMLRALYAKWIEYDPEAACQHALQYAVYEDGVMETSLRTWMADDTTAVLAWVRKLSAKERSPMLWFGINAALATGKNDPDSVAPLFIELCNLRGAAGEQFSEFFKTWSSRNPQRASTEALAIRNGMLRGAAIRSVAEAWGERDPHGALAWLANVQDEQTRGQAEARVLGAWAAHDFNAAASYAEQLPDEKARNFALVKIAAGLLKGDPESACTFAESLPLTLLEEGGFYREWSTKAPEAAATAYLQRLVKLDPEARRPHLDKLGQVFQKWNLTSPQLAAEFGLNQPEGVREFLIQEATESWTDKDRPAALQWSMNLPEGTVREAAFRSMAARWAQYSTNEVATWLQTLPAGPSREAAVTGFVKTAIRSDAEGALSWIRTIPDPQRSADALGNVWRAWVAEGGYPAAMRWLKEAHDITPLERASLEQAERSLRVE